MSIDPMTRARARLAVYEAAQRYLFDPKQKVNLVDFGPKKIGDQRIWDRPAIRFHVTAKLSTIRLEALNIPLIPKSIGPFETDVIVGTYRPNQWPWLGWSSGWTQTANPAQARADVLRGGISISDEYHYAAGTLGGKVRDRATGTEMILSNWHVLASDWGARPGQRIYQPGQLDGGTSADIVATLTRDAMWANLDAAVATLTGSRRLINEQLDIGSVTEVGKAEFGMEVVKSGRTSGVTHGRVTGLDGIAAITYGDLERVIHNVVTISPRMPGEQVSTGGDSGSWWLDSATRQVIGLHFAGSDDPERGLALDMQSVLEALNVTVASDH